ncbi:MAG TPA: glycosyltransferase family 2 protein [Planctomycetaceae bacterium]
MPRPFDPLLSVVVPCFNEQEVLRETHRRLSAALRGLRVDYEIVYVDDGSRDETPAILRELQSSDGRVRVVRFSRNFGHQVAVTAGMDHAAGDAVVLIDADLQDPPEVIADLLARWRDGYDVAYGRRTEREGETAFKRATASLFYRVLRALTPVDIPSDTGDFRLMDRAVVEALRRMPEQDRFVRGMVSWVGFRQTAVPYRREARFAGVSKYPVRRMLRLASDAIVSFSPLPLRLASYAGLATIAAGLLATAAVLGFAAATRSLPTAAAVGLAVALVLGGVQLSAIGLLGEYVSRIYRQVQGRPLYVVRETSGFGGEPEALDRAA